MDLVATTLMTMGPGQTLLAMVFLGSYAFALGEMSGLRPRLGALGMAVCAGAGFASFSPSWESAIVLVALGVVGMGAFAAVAWALWEMATWRSRTSYQVDVGLPFGYETETLRRSGIDLDQVARLNA